MNVYLMTIATILVLLGITIFQVDNDSYLQEQEFLKITADDCANAAASYYDEMQFSQGIKVFQKEEGNKAILYLLKNNLKLDDTMKSSKAFFKDTYAYQVTYFDGNGDMTTYVNGNYQQKKNIAYPYLFVEDTTNYKKLIQEPIVIVTINAGRVDYLLSFITDPVMIRTSGYEYVER